MSQGDLLFVYQTVLRPVLDFAAPTYHALLSITQTEQLETLQWKALKIIYSHLSYREALAVSNLEPLATRRSEMLKNFTLKTSKNPRFSDGWFPKKPQRHYNTRTNRPYLEVLAKTERMKKNPITYMRKLLNDHEASTKP